MNETAAKIVPPKPISSVVTWSTPNGATISICRECQTRLERAGIWIHDGAGREYCQVRKGLHTGYCEIHTTATAAQANIR